MVGLPTPSFSSRSSSASSSPLEPIVNFGDRALLDRGDSGLPGGDDGDRLPVSLMSTIVSICAREVESGMRDQARVRHLVQTTTANATPTSEMRMISAIKAPNLGLDRFVVTPAVGLAVMSALPTVLVSAVAVVFDSTAELLLELEKEALADTGCSVVAEAIGAAVSDVGWSVVSEAIGGALLALVYPFPLHHQCTTRC